MISQHIAIAEPGTYRRDAGAAGKGKTVRLDPAMVGERFATGRASRRQDPEGQRSRCLLRAVKNEAERAGTRAAHIRDGAAFVNFLAWFNEAAPKGGETEISVAEALERCRAQTGVLKDLSFPTIVAQGQTAIPPLPESRLKPAGHAGPVSHRFRGAICRRHHRHHPYHRGRRRHAPMKDRYTRVLKGHIAIALARFPGGRGLAT